MAEKQQPKRTINKMATKNIASAVNSSSGSSSVRSRQKIVQRNGRSVVIEEREERRDV